MPFLKKQFNPIIFIALMGTSALALASDFVLKNTFLAFFAPLLSFGVLFVFLWNYYVFLKHFFSKNFRESLKNPKKANLYSAMPIASALLAIIFSLIKLPFLANYQIFLSFLFWLNSLIFSLVFIILVPINLKFRSKIEHIAGTWFLPPVGLFVLINAGSVLALKNFSLADTIILINLFLFGPAFVLYFLTLNLLYFKSKIQEGIFEKALPAFHIVLAPVAVSILALLFQAKLMMQNDFLNIAESFLLFAKIYSLIMFGYGLWLLAGLITLYVRAILEKQKIPFSELWWAFVFPTGAFVLATINMSLTFGLNIFKVIYISLFYVFLVLWFYVFWRFIKNY